MMKKRAKYIPLRLLLYIGMLSLLWTCKSNTIAKNENKANDLAVLETLLNKQDYYISIDVVEPFNTAATTQVFNALLLRNTGNNANRIDVRADGNYIELQKDSAKANLPFFGERQLGGGHYGSNNTGIQFEDTLKDFTKHINTETVRLVLKFTAEQKDGGTESHQVSIEIFPNKNVYVTISPTHRTFISYKGTLKANDAVE